jgi:uncharacterized membrane protein
MSIFWDHDFSAADKKAIADAIHQAEENTSGEIRVYFEKSTEGYPLEERVAAAFEYLGIHKTAQRNGVLFYIAFEDHRFAVLGDEGIHHLVQQTFWDAIARTLGEYFSREAFVEGLVHVIREVGDQLHRHYPVQKTNDNELPNEPYFKNETPQ